MDTDPAPCRVEPGLEPRQAAAAPWRLELLQAARVRQHGGGVHVGSRKALAILAVLALEAGASRARLTALFWPDVDMAAGRRNLRRELFRLRELGLPLAGDADGALRLGAEVEIDATDLAAADAALSGSGLALDGLDGVAGLDFDAWLQRWRDRLAEQRVQALQARAEACERAGDLAAALQWYELARAADPLRDSAALHVMRLLVARGDSGGALKVYRQHCDALRGDLGVGPSQPLRALAEELRDTAGAALASLPPAPVVSSERATAPASTLPATVPYVERTALHERIDAAWRRGQRVYLHGPAGSGKTRLVSAWAAARGPWLRVACEPQDSQLPYSSVVRVLRALRDSAPAVALPDWVRRELSQLMPEFGAASPSLATDEARQRLLAAATQAWRLWMADNFSAFVLDDWHWGDAASVELWSRLDEVQVPGAPGVAWIVAYRSAQLPAAALQQQRLDVDCGRGIAIALEGMNAAEVLSLTRALSGAPGGTLFSQRLHAATEGNPFFLLETLRHLFEQGLLSAGADGWSTPFDEQTTDYAELPVPASVRAAVLSRVRALGPTVQRLLEVASLCSGLVEMRLLVGVTALGDDQVVAALEHAQAARLVEPAGSAWRFDHDLVRQSLSQGLSAVRRHLLHERLAMQLELQGAAPALIATHWEAAERRRDAVRWRVAAAEAAVRVHAPADALAQYAQALSDGAEGAVASRIHRAAAQIHMQQLDRHAADQALAAAVAAAAADPAESTSEALGAQLDRADHLRETDRVDESLALLDALAPALVDAAAPLRAQALGAHASILLRTGGHREGVRLFEQAVELLAGLVDARGQRGALLLEHARLCLRRGEFDGARSIGQRAVALHESIDAPIGLAQSLVVTGIVHIYVGEAAQARADLERARALAQRCGHVPTQRAAILNLVKLHTDHGETAAAVTLLDEGEHLAPVFEHRRAELAFREARFFVHFLRGEVDAARAAAERLLAFADGGGVASGRIGPHALDPLERIGACMLVVDLFLQVGDLDRARALLGGVQVLSAALQAAGEGHQYAAACALKQAWLALAEGCPAEALMRLPAGELPRLEDRFSRAWIGAAAARQLGDAALARQHLATATPSDQVPTDQLVQWLRESLNLIAVGDTASQTPVALVVLVACARDLLTAGRVPALLAEELERAMARHQPGG